MILKYMGKTVGAVNPTIRTDDTLTINDDILGVSIPTKGITQAEYEKLEDKNGLYIIVDAEPDNSSSNSIPSGCILMWSGTAETVPDGWHICDGTDGTPDLSGKFVLGVSGTHTQGSIGGSETVTLNTTQLPEHSHGFSGSTIQYNTSFRLTQDKSAVSSLYYYSAVANKTNGSGQNQPHSNMPPYYTLFYIMKL